MRVRSHAAGWLMCTLCRCAECSRPPACCSAVANVGPPVLDTVAYCYDWPSSVGHYGFVFGPLILCFHGFLMNVCLYETHDSAIRSQWCCVPA